jgi:hypothetical protein
MLEPIPLPLPNLPKSLFARASLPFLAGSLGCLLTAGLAGLAALEAGLTLRVGLAALANFAGFAAAAALALAALAL